MSRIFKNTRLFKIDDIVPLTDFWKFEMIKNDSVSKILLLES